jgi:hypothetical protein
VGLERARQFGPYYYSVRSKEMFSLVREDWKDSILVFGLYKAGLLAKYYALITDCV